ncbi:MAG: amino acid permease [Bacteroidetes bacterium]|jgi:APA family basic amino acid/polyamine antiporter|nr:amino acid permease [Bacteroidota bacterium]
MSSPDLRRSLSLFDLSLIAIGSSIGSGIFLTPALIAQSLDAPMWILGVWLLGGVMALCGALTFAELGAMLPRAGGVYAFLTEAYGGTVGFLYGWAYFLVANTGALGALAIAFSTYFGYFVPLSETGTLAVAIGGIILVTIINVLGVKAGGIFSDVFTLLKLAGIGVLVVAGFGWGSAATTDLFTSLSVGEGGLASAITLAAVSVLWSYGGWQHATFTAAEAKDPQRTVPRALIIGASVVTAVYLITNLAYLFLLTPQQMAASPRVAADALASVMGPVGGSIIALTIFISTFGTTGIYTLTAPRIYYAMAADGVFFRKVAEVHPRFHTPIYAILLQSVWAIILLLFWGTYEKLISYVVFTDWIFFALAAAAVFVLRRTRPTADRPYRTFGYPFTPALFVLLASLFVLYTLVEKPLESGVGLAFLALGIPVYRMWRRA